MQVCTDTHLQTCSAPKSGVRCWRVLLESGKLGNEGSYDANHDAKPRQRRH